MFLYEAVLSQNQVICLCKADVSAEFFQHDHQHSQLMLLHTQSLQSLTVLDKRNEAGDLGWQADTLNDVSRQHPADVVEGRVDL
jgi:hypothetical protein